MKEQKLMTVHAFARAVNRPPSYVYKLITHGNQYRKLLAEKVDGKWMVHASEVSEFPFNVEDKVRSELENQILDMRAHIGLLQEELDMLTNKETNA